MLALDILMIVFSVIKSFQKQAALNIYTSSFKTAPIVRTSPNVIFCCFVYKLKSTSVWLHADKQDTVNISIS